MSEQERNYWTSAIKQRAFSRRSLLRSAGLGAAGLAGAALLGCGDDDAPGATATTAPGGNGGTATAAPTEAAGDAIKRGGIYRDSTITVAPHFSPFHPGADPSYINTWRRTNYYDAMWESTASDDPDQQIRLGLAESIEHVDDTTVVVKLHRANFHNQPASRSNGAVGGRQLTAEDVVARYEFVRVEPASSNAFVQDELTVTALDDLTVEFKMARPFAFFYENNGATGGTRMYEVPQEMLDETTLKEDIPIGTGPYMYKSHQLGSREELVRNPDYWREDVPYLDGRTLTFIPDNAAGEAAFRGGQIEDIGFSNIRQAETIGADLGDEIRTVEYPSTSGMALVANIRREPWTDERVRRAVHRAINFERINNVVYFGAATPAWYFSKARPERFPTGREPHLDIVGYDPTEAKALLDAAKADGGYDGREIEFMLPVEAQEWVDSGALIAEDLTAIGFNVRPFTEVRNVYLGLAGPKDLEDMTKPSSFDLTMTVFLDYQYAKTDSGTFWNNTSLEDPEVDAIINDIEGTVDAGARAELSQRFERMLAEKASNFIPILSGQLFHGYYETVQGVDHELSQSGKGGQQLGYWLDV
ncbi:MAG: ABC transporter substrate-binding protein [Dehalococcoidia bacterium]